MHSGYPEWFHYGCTQKRACTSLLLIYDSFLPSFHDRLGLHTTVNLCLWQASTARHWPLPITNCLARFLLSQSL
jgi:hypothetical protein